MTGPSPSSSSTDDNHAAPPPPPPPSNTSGPIHQYFKHLAANYPYLTGNTTKRLFTQLLQNEIQKTSSHPITPKSIIHDIAAGPGTATSALLEHLGGPEEGSLPEFILVSDNEENMVSSASKNFSSYLSSSSSSSSSKVKIRCENLDAHSLSSSSSATPTTNHFTHTILNFSIFNLRDPVTAIREIHRTLLSPSSSSSSSLDGGMAIFTCWQRFALVDMVHFAQRRVRGEGNLKEEDLMRAAGPEFFREGHLEKVIVEGGFDPEKMTSSKQEIIVGEKELDGLRDFIFSPFTARARRGYTEAEEEAFREAIEDFIQEEQEKYGGVRFTSFGVLAVK